MTGIDEQGIYEVEYGDPPPGAMGRAKAMLSTLSGAALAVGLVLGVGWWLTDLGTREAESLPVFHSTVAKPRVQPADPGGVVTPYRDISSYGAAAGMSGSAGETMPAPAPATPQDGDVAMAALSASGSGQGTRDEALEDDAAASQLELSTQVEVPLPARRPAELEADREAAVETATRPIDAEPITPAAASDQGPTPMPFDDDDNPVPDAAEILPQVQQQVDQAAQLATRAALSPVQIQLGAYTDRGFTESEWQRISTGNRDLLQGRALAIQSTVSGGARYYRLRVGPFEDRAEAVRVCEQLKARGQDCIVASNG